MGERICNSESIPITCQSRNEMCVCKLFSLCTYFPLVMFCLYYDLFLTAPNKPSGCVNDY